MTWPSRALALTAKRLPPDAPADLALLLSLLRATTATTVKVDNRPAAARDGRPGRRSQVHTVGGHAITAVDAGPGTVDGLLGGACAGRRWGRHDHGAWAFAFEAGYQLPRLPAAPWLRIGIDRSSGDDDPNDGVARELLPGAADGAHLRAVPVLQPDERPGRVRRADPEAARARRASAPTITGSRLTEARDLWYAGGGATNDDASSASPAPRPAAAASWRRSPTSAVDVQVHRAPHARRVLRPRIRPRRRARATYPGVERRTTDSSS